MSVVPVGSSSSQNIGALVLQLLTNNSGSQTTDGAASGNLSDLLSLSPASQQLSKAPDAVTKAMSDLFSDQNNVSDDLSQLKSYFQQNPASLAQVLSSLQGGGTYGASGSIDSNSALISALLNHQNGSSESGALVSLLMGSGSQDPLIASLGDSSGSATSLFA